MIIPYKMYKITLLIATCMLLGCSSPAPQPEIYAPPVFSRQSEARIQVLNDSVELFGSSCMVPYKEHLIVVSRRDGNWLQIFDKRTGQHQGSFLPVGKGPGEAVQVTSVDVYPATGILTLIDKSTRKIFDFQLDSVVLNRKRTPEKECLLSDPDIVPADIFHTAKGKLIRRTGSDTKRLATIENGQCTAEYNRYPASEDSLTLQKSYADASKTVSPDGTKVAFGLKYGCILEILDLTNGIHPKAVRYFYKPEMAPGPGNIAPCDQTVFGFADLYATNDRIYGTYRGTKEMDAIQGIAVFDWEGKEQYFFTTDPNHLLIDFCVEPSDSILYGIDLDKNSGEFRLISMPVSI